jgi:DnaK suppressor protein
MNTQNGKMKTDVKGLLKAACLRSRKNKASENRDEYFSMSDVDRIIAERMNASEKETVNASKKVEVRETQNVVSEKRVFKSATLSDILGFNPRKAQNTDIGKDTTAHVPEKWQKHYQKLLSLKNKIQMGVDDGDVAIDLSSNPQQLLQEIEAAIRRIENGTYGICEITNEPISPERLDSIPYTRYSLEGQRQLEEAKRMRILTQQANQQHISDSDDEDGDEKRPFYEADEDADLTAEFEE